jgi:4'-phosphopantetheinyl transferase
MRRVSEPAAVPPVEVWRVDSPEDAPLARWHAVLDADEQARADRLRRPDDRARQITAHTALRLVLGARLGIDAASVRLGRAPCPLCAGEHGRPIVVDDHLGGDDGVGFSLSHCRGLVLVAVHDHAVGVDAEPADRTELDALATALDPEEREAMRSVAAPDRAAALLSCWVRKEAYLKAIGTGLGVEPSTVPVGVDRADARLGDWAVLDLPEVGPGHVGGLAVDASRGRPSVVVRDLVVRFG